MFGFHHAMASILVTVIGCPDSLSANISVGFSMTTNALRTHAIDDVFPTGSFVTNYILFWYFHRPYR